MSACMPGLIPTGTPMLFSKFANWFVDRISDALLNINWAIQQADMTQWTIVTIALVLAGFLCLRSSR